MIAEYVQNIKRGATTIFEGMAVTFSHMLRPPITTQYPDRMPKPMQDLIPQRYRGFLWVDLDICISCRLCERYCPIDCIHIEDTKIDKILVESRLDGKPTPKIKDPLRFDINLYKCMFCGLCVEPCPTGAIFFTKEFEGASTDLSDMHLRLVDEGRRVQVEASAAEAERKAQAAKEAKAKAAAAAAAKKATADQPAAEKVADDPTAPAGGGNGAKAASEKSPAAKAAPAKGPAAKAASQEAPADSGEDAAEETGT